MFPEYTVCAGSQVDPLSSERRISKPPSSFGILYFSTSFSKGGAQLVTNRPSANTIRCVRSALVVKIAGYKILFIEKVNVALYNTYLTITWIFTVMWSEHCIELRIRCSHNEDQHRHPNS
jgi:hypothetical protein